MQPEQPQYPQNYLDSIAVQQPVKTINPLILWGLIAGIIILLIVVVMSVMASGTSPTQRLTAFGAQMKELKTVASESQENIQSGDLRSLNGSLSLTLTNANRELATPLTTLGAKIDDEKNELVLMATADAAELKERLEDARLNAVFDRTYAREMAFSLKTLRSEIVVIYDSTRSNSLKQVLVDTDKDLESLQTSFDDFNEG